MTTVTPIEVEPLVLAAIEGGATNLAVISATVECAECEGSGSVLDPLFTELPSSACGARNGDRLAVHRYCHHPHARGSARCYQHGGQGTSVDLVECGCIGDRIPRVLPEPGGLCTLTAKGDAPEPKDDGDVWWSVITRADCWVLHFHRRDCLPQRVEVAVGRELTRTVEAVLPIAEWEGHKNTPPHDRPHVCIEYGGGLTLHPGFGASEWMSITAELAIQAFPVGSVAVLFTRDETEQAR